MVGGGLLELSYFALIFVLNLYIYVPTEQQYSVRVEYYSLFNNSFVFDAA